MSSGPRQPHRPSRIDALRESTSLNADSVCKLFGCWTLDDIKIDLPPSWTDELTGLQRFDTKQIFDLLDAEAKRRKGAAEEKRKADLARWIQQSGEGRRYG